MFKTLSNKEMWNVMEQDFAQVDVRREKLRFLLGYAVLAPSSHNTQPWSFRIGEGDVIEVYADQARWLRIADADKRELYISVGCSLENLLIAAGHFGYETSIDYFPRAGDEDLVARLSLASGSITQEIPNTNLFDFITERSTFHGTFTEEPISESVLDEILSYTAEPGINLYLTSNDEIRRRVDDLIVRSDAKQFADPAFRAELSHWIGEGVFGNSWLMAQIGSLAVAYLDLGKSTAKTDSKVLRSAPVLGLITSAENDRASQIKAGQVFERIYLAARKHNLGLRPISQIVQIPEHKEELKKLVPQNEAFPQQPFLLGYAEVSDAHTPRRSVEEVLTK